MAKSRTIRARKKKFEQLRNLLGFCCCCVTRRRPDAKIVGIDDFEFDKTSNACVDVLPSLVVGSAAPSFTSTPGHLKEKLGISGMVPLATKLGQLGPLVVGAATPAFTPTPAYLEEKLGTVSQEIKLDRLGQGDTGIRVVDNRTLSEMILDHMIMQIVMKCDRNNEKIQTRPPPPTVLVTENIKVTVEHAHVDVERRGENETLVRQLLYSIADASTRTPSRPVPPTRPPQTYRNVVQNPQQVSTNMEKSEMMRHIVDEVIDDVLRLCEEKSREAVTPPVRPPAPKWNIVQRQKREIVDGVHGKYKIGEKLTNAKPITKRAQLPIRPPAPKLPPPVSAKSKPARPEKPIRVPACKSPTKHRLPTRPPTPARSNVPSPTKPDRPERPTRVPVCKPPVKHALPTRPPPPDRPNATPIPTAAQRSRPEKPPRPAPPVRHAQQKPQRPPSPKRVVKPVRPLPPSRVAEKTKHEDDVHLNKEVTQPVDDYPEELNPFADDPDDDNHDDSNQAADDYPEDLNPFSD